MNRSPRVAVTLFVLGAIACGSDATTPKPQTPYLAPDLTCPNVEVLAKDQLTAYYPTLNSSSVFWISNASPPPATSTGSLPYVVNGVPLAGGAPRVVASSDISSSFPIAADDVSLFYVDVPPGASTNAGPLTQAPLAGGAGVTLGTFRAGRIALDADHVYWAESALGGSLVQIPKGGGTVVTLASAALGSNGTFITSMVVSGGTVFFAESGSQAGSASLKSVPVAGGKPTVVLSGLGRVTAVGSVRGTSIYFSEAPGDASSPYAVKTVDVTGSNLRTISADASLVGQSTTSPAPVVIGSTLYYLGKRTGDADVGLYSVPEAGGTPTRISCGVNTGWGPLTDGTYLYWSLPNNSRTSAIFRMHAPGP